MPTAAVAKRIFAKIQKEYAKERSFTAKSYANVYEAGTKTEDQPELRPLREAAHAFLVAPDAAKPSD